ncbi:MAG: pyridoxal phosphate-dependent aminotransferase [Desulfobacteraceae bacterium]|nr:MAG: pyridoxal phosphate-dependent aminotransferase [Desulfobacteraceae bacterium]
MKSKIAACVREVVPSVIRQMSILASKYDNVISLGIGEPDFHTPAQICEAALADARAGHTHYTPSRGDAELLEALRRLIREKRGIELDMSELLITHGGMGGLNGFLRAALEPGDQVLVPEPHFPTYKAQICFAGGEIVYVPVRYEEGFVLQPDAVRRALTPRCKVLILNSPNNPTGSIMSGEILDELARIAVEHDLLVLSDEVYERLVFTGRHDSIYTRPGMPERTVVVNSFSKSYAMTGWRMGYAYGAAWLIEEMLKVITYQTSCASSVGQRAALAALRADERIFEEMAREFGRRCAYVYERLHAIPGVRVLPAAGAFYMFPDISAVDSDCRRFATDLIKEEQLVVIPGAAFGPSGCGFVRLACTVNMERTKEAMDRLERFIRRRISA